MRLRAGVIGVGDIGRRHAEVYAADPRTDLVGVADTSPGRAHDVARHLGAQAFGDTAALIQHARPDILSIAVPEQHRRGPALAAAAEGIHLLLEKPLSPSLADTDTLANELKSAPITVAVNFILRHEPRYAAVQAALASGRLGRLCTMSAYRRMSVEGADILRPWTGLLISTAIHDIDAMSWMAGAPVERVYAESVSTLPGDVGREDAVVATLRYRNGVVGVLDTSWVSPASVPAPLSSALQTVGTGGSTEIRGSDYGLSIVDPDGFSLPDMAHWPSGPGGVGGALRASIGHFIEDVLSGREPPAGLAEARAAESVVDAIRRSLRTGAAENLSGA